MFKSLLSRQLRTSYKGNSSSIISSLRSSRLYHSTDHASSNIIVNPNRLENKILTKALEYVNQYGFTSTCVNKAVREMDYSDSVLSVLTATFNGNSLELQLILHWLKVQRQKLQDEYNNEDSHLYTIENEYDRAAFLINKRLSYNKPIIDKLLGGISQLLLPYNMTASIEELHNLGDDIAFYAGDLSNDFSWYAKRFSLSTVYVSSELFMLQDTSKDFINTKNFVEDKVKNIDHLGTAYEGLEQWTIFNAIGLFNLIKSQTLRG